VSSTGAITVVTESPTVARRQLRQAIRRARDAKALTQGQVAEALEWSLSKVNRIESGDVTVSNTDLRALLALLEIRDPDTVTRLAEIGRVARRREDAHSHITPAMRQLFEYEREATAIAVFQPTLVPGLLQTEPYATAVLEMSSDVFPELELAARIEARLQARLQRRSNILNRKQRPDYRLILDESVVHRVVGNREVTAGQLESLATTAKDGQIAIRILPFADGLALSMIGAFTIVELPDDDIVLYTEASRVDSIVENVDDVNAHRNHFERAWARSMSPEDSIGLIERVRDNLRQN
jgi:transcriptional regulator with XRE-family HTH domain